MRILFITSSRVGEAVISCGVLEALRTQYPKAPITVACGASCTGLFARLPRLERIITVGKGTSRDFHRFRVWSKLFGRFWDIAVDTRGSSILYFLAAGQRIVIHARHGLPLYRQFAAALRLSPPPLPVVWINASDATEAKRRLPGQASLIGLGPTASSTRRIWPPERFIETYRAIAKNLPDSRPVIFTGVSDAERLAGAEIQARLPGALLLPATLPLPLLAACMARMRLYIGNDTGLLQLAAAAQAPVVGLFERDRVAEFAPAGPHATAVAAPAGSHEGAMASLTVDTVLAAALPLLDRAEKASDMRVS